MSEGFINQAYFRNEVESTEPSSVERSWKSCAICLEDMEDSKLRKHTSCCCLLCQLCIEVRLNPKQRIIFIHY